MAELMSLPWSPDASPEEQIRLAHHHFGIETMVPDPHSGVLHGVELRIPQEATPIDEWVSVRVEYMTGSDPTAWHDLFAKYASLSRRGAAHGGTDG